MTHTSTAPSVVTRSERAARRASARALREVAEGEPRPSLRGRPRRSDDSASLYVLSVRLRAPERALVQAAALAANMSMADFVRHQVTGLRRSAPPPQVVHLPAVVDSQYARAVVALGNNTNQLARAWNTLRLLVKQGKHLPDELDLKGLHTITERLGELLEQISPAQLGTVGRLMAAARVALGKAPKG